MAHETLKTWIYVDNLQPFLTVLGWLVKYEFDSMDWDAIQPAALKTSVEKNSWFEYVFIGEQTAKLKIALADGCCLYEIVLDIPSEIKDRIDLAVSMLTEFNLGTSTSRDHE